MSENTLQISDHPPLTIRFQFLITITAFWLLIGTHLDGWAHNNLPSSLETFFTAWHAVLYSGFIALASVHLYEYVKNINAGFPARRAMPEGFLLSVLGVPMFFAGGLGDSLWHIFLGVELSVDALYSPTHLIIAVAAALLLTGPIRYYWKYTEEWDRSSYTEKLPMLLMTSFFIAILFFFHQFAVPTHLIFPSNPVGDYAVFAMDFYNEGLGMTGIFLFTIIMGLSIQKLNVKFNLEMGMNAIFYGVVVLFTTSMNFPVGPDADSAEQLARLFFVLLAIGVGFVVDWANQSLTPEQLSYTYLVGALVLFFMGYLIILHLTLGFVYTIHLVLGIPVIVAIIGYLIKLSQID